jgi:hypothetical protein
MDQCEVECKSMGNKWDISQWNHIKFININGYKWKIDLICWQCKWDHMNLLYLKNDRTSQESNIKGDHVHPRKRQGRKCSDSDTAKSESTPVSVYLS